MSPSGLTTGARIILAQRYLIGIATVGALVHVVTLFPTAWSLYRAVPADARPVIVAVSASLVMAIIACALALLLIVRAGARYEARHLALFLVLVAICWGSVLRFASIDRGPDGAATGLSINVSGAPLLLAIVTLALASAALLRLSVRFPSDLVADAEDRWSLSRWPWAPWVLAVATPFLLQLGISIVGRAATLLGVEGETMARFFPWALWTVSAIIGTIVLGMLALAVSNFLTGYRRADPDSRRSALWLVVGVVGSGILVLASTLLIVLDIVLPVSLGLLSRYSPLIVFFAPLFMVICVGVAVLFSGAVDPRLALRRSTINGIAGTFGLLVFAGLENAVSAWVETRLGLPGIIGSFLAGAVSAAVFVPIRWGLRRTSLVSTRSRELQ